HARAGGLPQPRAGGAGDRMSSAGWSTQQLAEFVVAISGASDDVAALERGVERACEALDAEVGAVVREGAVVASVGWPRFDVPEPELLALGETGGGHLPIPGWGKRPAAVVPLDDEPGGALVVERYAAPVDAVVRKLQ